MCITVMALNEWKIELEPLNPEKEENIQAHFHDIKEILGYYIKISLNELNVLLGHHETQENYYKHKGLKNVEMRDVEKDLQNFFLVLGISLQRYRIALLFENVEGETLLVAIYPEDFLGAVEHSAELLKKLLRKIIYQPWEWETVDVITPITKVEMM